MAATCEVWWATPSDIGVHRSLLDDAESRRAERLRQPGDRDRFVTARALLRLVLAARTGLAPTAIALGTNCDRCGADHGRPRLLDHGATEISISHAGGRVAVAVSDGARIGVDVEIVDATTAERLTALPTSLLGPLELVELRRFTSAQRPRALAVWWTRKEALLKATGDGLTVPMSSITVTAPDEPAALRSARDPQRSTAAMALLHDLAPDDMTVACVAALGVSSLTVVEHDGDEVLARARTIAPTAVTRCA